MRNDYEVLAEQALFAAANNEFSNSYNSFIKYFKLVENKSNISVNPYHNYNALLYYNFGVVCNRLNKKEEALKNLGIALKQVDLSFNYADNLNGSILMTNIISLENTIKKNFSSGFNSAVEAFNAGFAKLNNGDYFGAIDFYSKAIQISGGETYYAAFNNRAVAKCAIRDYNGAINDFNVFLKYENLIPKSELVDTYYNLGYSYQETNKYEEALKFYKKALEINPYDTDIKHKVSYLESIL